MDQLNEDTYTWFERWECLLFMIDGTWVHPQELGQNVTFLVLRHFLFKIFIFILNFSSQGKGKWEGEGLRDGGSFSLRFPCFGGNSLQTEQRPSQGFYKLWIASNWKTRCFHDTSRVYNFNQGIGPRRKFSDILGSKIPTELSYNFRCQERSRKHCNSRILWVLKFLHVYDFNYPCFPKWSAETI